MKTIYDYIRQVGKPILKCAYVYVNDVNNTVRGAAQKKKGIQYSKSKTQAVGVQTKNADLVHLSYTRVYPRI